MAHKGHHCIRVLYLPLRMPISYKDFVWELLDRVIYKTLYGYPLDFSKIHDIVINDEIKLTYLLLSVYLSVLCNLGPFGAIWSDLSIFLVEKLGKFRPFVFKIAVFIAI